METEGQIDFAKVAQEQIEAKKAEKKLNNELSISPDGTVVPAKDSQYKENPESPQEQMD